MDNTIISIFVGCDIRDKSTFSYYTSKYHLNDICRPCQEIPPPKCDPRRARRVVRGAERYSDIILTVPDIAFLLTKPFYYFWLPMELERYPFQIPKNRVPRIIHAPSDRVLKGTDLILKSMEKLRESGYQFQEVLLEKMSNREVLEYLSEGDIVIAECYSNITAKLPLEGMACGCAVLCGLNKEFMGLPEECPAITIEPDPDQICRTLKALLDHPERIYDLAKQGRDYVEKYHDSSKVVKQITRWIKDRPTEIGRAHV